MVMQNHEMREGLPDFRGRVVCVLLANKPSKEGKYIVDPYFEKQGGRIFLMGTLSQSWDELAGHTVGIAWDRVESYIVADSMEVFQKAYSQNDEE